MVVVVCEQVDVIVQGQVFLFAWLVVRVLLQACVLVSNLMLLFLSKVEVCSGCLIISLKVSRWVVVVFESTRAGLGVFLVAMWVFS